MHTEYIEDHKHCIMSWPFWRWYLYQIWAALLNSRVHYTGVVLCWIPVVMVFFFQLLGISMLLPLLKLTRHSFHGRHICLQGSWNMVSNQLSQLFLNVISIKNEEGSFEKKFWFSLHCNGENIREVVRGFIKY